MATTFDVEQPMNIFLYKPKMKHILYIKLSLLLFALVGCTTSVQSDSLAPLNKIFLPPHYKADAIEGWVMDAETKEPIEDAIVIVFWELERPYNMENPIPSGHMQVAEVLTDTQGHYQIPAWGPKQRSGKAYMGRNDPLIIVFKSEYDYLKLRNPHGFSPETRDKREEIVHNSVWHGKTVELKRFEGGLEEYYGRLKRVRSLLDPFFSSVFGANACDWQKIPQMVLTFDNYYAKLKKAELRHRLLPSLDNLLLKGDCGTKKEFMRDKLK